MKKNRYRNIIFAFLINTLYRLYRANKKNFWHIHFLTYLSTNSPQSNGHCICLKLQRCWWCSSSFLLNFSPQLQIISRMGQSWPSWCFLCSFSLQRRHTTSTSEHRPRWSLAASSLILPLQARHSPSIAVIRLLAKIFLQKAITTWRHIAHWMARDVCWNR